MHNLCYFWFCWICFEFLLWCIELTHFFVLKFRYLLHWKEKWVSCWMHQVEHKKIGKVSIMKQNYNFWSKKVFLDNFSLFSQSYAKGRKWDFEWGLTIFFWIYIYYFSYSNYFTFSCRCLYRTCTNLFYFIFIYLFIWSIGQI